MTDMKQARWETVSPDELAHQAELAAQVRKMGGGHFFIETFGCQMNVNDSQKIAGLLSDMGYTPCAQAAQADIIVFNTCCVREGAEKRIYGHIGAVKKLWEQNRRVIVCVCGCMMQQQGAAEALLARHPFVRIVFGTNRMHLLPGMVLAALCGEKRVVETGGKEEGGIAEGVPVLRENGVSVFTTIMYGCDNYCSYCIVPSVRGRERSRHPDDVIRELEALAEKGVKEVTLLGQNVNSYGKGIKGASFAGLLRRADETGIQRIRFMTSHPKDISEDVLSVMAAGKRICKQLHLPVQSGSDRVLAAMNRHYDSKRYLEIVDTARRLMPDIGITTDIIVGFPGETDDDFEKTIELVKRVRFDSAYTFKFSKRRGTKAYSMQGQVPGEVKKERIVRLIAAQDRITREICAGFIGKRLPVLADGVSRRTKSGYSGRLERGITVNFTSDQDMLGKMIDLTIAGAKHNTLTGAADGQINI